MSILFLVLILLDNCKPTSLHGHMLLRFFLPQPYTDAHADYATASLLFLSAIVGVLISRPLRPVALRGHGWDSIVINANIWQNVLEMKYGVLSAKVQ